MQVDWTVNNADSLPVLIGGGGASARCCIILRRCLIYQKSCAVENITINENNCSLFLCVYHYQDFTPNFLVLYNNRFTISRN